MPLKVAQARAKGSTRIGAMGPGPRMTLPERAQQSQGKGSATMIIFRALCACTEVQCLSTLSYTKRVLSKPSKWVT